MKNKKIELLKDIIIPKGTILNIAPALTRRAEGNHFYCTVGLTKNSCGIFDYYIDPSDIELADYFKVINEK